MGWWDTAGVKGMFSADGYRANILGFAGHVAPIAMTQVCSLSTKEATGNIHMYRYVCIPINFNLQKQAMC